jgi:TM2 domain-containing membrane protein YozV
MKKKSIALILCPLGLHRFYLGHIRSGILFFFSSGGIFIWMAIDLMKIINGNMKDSNGNGLVGGTMPSAVTKLGGKDKYLDI